VSSAPRSIASPDLSPRLATGAQQPVERPAEVEARVERREVQHGVLEAHADAPVVAEDAVGEVVDAEAGHAVSSSGHENQ
jgi:hypothetical protein